MRGRVGASRWSGSAHGRPRAPWPRVLRGWRARRGRCASPGPGPRRASRGRPRCAVRVPGPWTRAWHPAAPRSRHPSSSPHTARYHHGMRRVCSDRHAVNRIPVRRLTDAGPCGPCRVAPPHAAPVGRNVRGAVDEIIAIDARQLERFAVQLPWRSWSSRRRHRPTSPLGRCATSLGERSGICPGNERPARVERPARSRIGKGSRGGVPGALAPRIAVLAVAQGACHGPAKRGAESTDLGARRGRSPDRIRGAVLDELRRGRAAVAPRPPGRAQDRARSASARTPARRQPLRANEACRRLNFRAGSESLFVAEWTTPPHGQG
jgi:hypothetical protein